MRVTPLDVRKQEFRKSVRGYDQDEVRAFLTTAADEYEAVLIDNKQVRERNMQLEEKLAEFRTLETTLRDTMMTAEKVLQETKINARKESELILRNAELGAQQQRERFRAQAEVMRRDILNLHKEKENYLARFRSLAEAQISFLDNHHQDFEELDRQLISMAETTAQTQPTPATTYSAPLPTDTPTSAPTAISATTQTPQPVKTGEYHAPEATDMWRNYDPGAQSAAETQASVPGNTEAPMIGPENREPIATASIDTDIDQFGSSEVDHDGAVGDNEQNSENNEQNYHADENHSGDYDHQEGDHQEGNHQEGDQHQEHNEQDQGHRDWDENPDTCNG